MVIETLNDLNFTDSVAQQTPFVFKLCSCCFQQTIVQIPSIKSSHLPPPKRLRIRHPSLHSSPSIPPGDYFCAKRIENTNLEPNKKYLYIDNHRLPRFFQFDDSNLVGFYEIQRVFDPKTISRCVLEGYFIFQKGRQNHCSCRIATMKRKLHYDLKAAHVFREYRKRLQHFTGSRNDKLRLIQSFLQRMMQIVAFDQTQTNFMIEFKNNEMHLRPLPAKDTLFFNAGFCLHTLYQDLQREYSN